MGFYFRKSVRLGPLRFNLSKSGIGVSAGIRGLRIGSGPRGNFIHIGAGGLYYRQTLSPSRARADSKAPSRYAAPKDLPEHTSGAMEEVTSGSVSKMVDSTSRALLAELDAKRKQPSVFLVSSVASLAALLLLIYLQPGGWWLVSASLTLLAANGYAYYWDLLNKSVVMMYDLEKRRRKPITSYTIRWLP